MENERVGGGGVLTLCDNDVTCSCSPRLYSLLSSNNNWNIAFSSSRFGLSTNLPCTFAIVYSRSRVLIPMANKIYDQGKILLRWFRLALDQREKKTKREKEEKQSEKLRLEKYIYLMKKRKKLIKFLYDSMEMRNNWNYPFVASASWCIHVLWCIHAWYPSSVDIHLIRQKWQYNLWRIGPREIYNMLFFIFSPALDSGYKIKILQFVLVEVLKATYKFRGCISCTFDQNFSNLRYYAKMHATTLNMSRPFILHNNNFKRLWKKSAKKYPMNNQVRIYICIFSFFFCYKIRICLVTRFHITHIMLKNFLGDQSNSFTGYRLESLFQK